MTWVGRPLSLEASHKEVFERGGYLGSDLWGTQAPCGAGIHLGIGICSWAWEELEAVNTFFFSFLQQCLQNATIMVPPALLQRGQRVAAVAVGSQVVLQMLSRVSGRQAPHRPSDSAGVGAGPVVVLDGGREGPQPPPSSSRSQPGPLQKAK